MLFLPPATFSTGGRMGGGGGGRGSRRNTTPRERTQTVAAMGALLPIHYGRVRIPGLVFAVGTDGTDLVVGYAWGVGPIHAIDEIYINDEAPHGSITITNYTGTPTQDVDPALALAISAYADTLRFDTPAGKRGIAYSVLRIPTGILTEWPKVQAVIRGRTVYDPRADEIVYSDNAALCLGDLITDPDYGHGVPAYGLADAANWCDTLIGNLEDLPRCRLGLSIVQGATTESYVDLLAEYAEVFWSYDGDGIRLTPNAPVDLESVPVIGAGDVVKGSLSIRAEDSTLAPTEVEIQYMLQTEDAENWSVQPATPARLSGVTEGTVQRIPQSITMEGVYRAEEATLKAQATLKRQQHVVSVSWTTFDAGVRKQRGDVVRLSLPAHGVDMPVRIMGVDMTQPGRYGVIGARYDASHYPGDVTLPDEVGIVPEGAIVILNGATVPDGWADYADANGRFIRGAGGAFSIGATGGGGDVTFTGNTTTNGAHTAGSGTFEVPAKDGSGNSLAYTSTSSASLGGHAHSIGSQLVTPSPARRDDRLIIKTVASALRFPEQARIFGLANLQNPDVQRIFEDAGRILRAHTEAGGFAENGSKSFATASANDSHSHTGVSNNSGNPGGNFQTWRGVSGGGSHNHSGTLGVQTNPARRNLALYGGLRDYAVTPGMIVMWAGVTLPADWKLCDGSDGTPDMRDLFVAISPSGQEGNSSGDNTVTAFGSMSSVTHRHNQTTNQTQLPLTNQGRHSTNVSHTHTYSSTQAWTPPYYALAFIMFQPGT